MGKWTFVDPRKPRLPSHRHRVFLRLPSPPLPRRPCCHQASAAIVSLVAAIFATVIKPPNRFSPVEAEWCVSPAMSAVEKGSPALGGQNRGRGGVGQDPGSNKPAESGARVAYPRDFQAIVRAHVEEQVWLEIPEVIIENWDLRQSPYHSSLKKWLNISMATLRRRPRKREVRKRMNVKNQKKDSKWTWTAQRAAPENPVRRRRKKRMVKEKNEFVPHGYSSLQGLKTRVLFHSSSPNNDFT
ncbi:uncharacterized protein [Equus caballus]|uniref:uncharacterized protein isoform X2 n=1 Tax=Equus caballus TaxID=9796 RepID=UPI0038B33F05